MIVRIADEVLDFTPAHVDFFEERMKDYVVDGAGETLSNALVPDMIMTVKFAVEFEVDVGRELQKIEGRGTSARRFALENNQLEYEYEIVNYSHQKIPVSRIRYNGDYSRVEIVINSRFQPWHITLCEYEYLLTGAWFAYFLSKKNGMMFHSSAMKFQDKGVLFSGNPGAGKSTHVSLWEKYYGEEVAVINDDKPIIKYVDDVAYVYGTPWSGKTDKNANIKAKLDKIFFVVQAKENCVSEMAAKQAVFNLISQVQKPFHDAELIDHNLILIDRIVREHGVYELRCDVSREAVEKVREVL